MKKTILIGYAKTDASGNPIGAPKIISDPPVDADAAQEQASLFDRAKRLHQFPKGIRFIAFGTVEVTDQAAFISNDVTDQVRNDASAREEREAIAQRERDKITNARAAVAALPKAKTAVAIAKDALIRKQKSADATKADAVRAAGAAKTEAEKKTAADLQKIADLHADALKAAIEAIPAAEAALENAEATAAKAREFLKSKNQPLKK